MLLKIGAAFAFALVVVNYLPRDGSGSQPPVGHLLLVALLVTAAMTAAVLAGIVLDLGLPLRIGLYVAGWNALVILVKLVLAPHGMYDLNQTEEITTWFAPDTAFGAWTIALAVFALYGTAYIVIYKIVKPRLEPGLVPERRRRGWVVALLVGAIAIAAVSTGAVVLPFLALIGGINYLDFVFSSVASLLVAGALALATTLLVYAFRDTADQANAVGDAAVLVTVFWVGLAFLALYHVLWVVYILVLTATWPLRTITPK